MANGGVPNIFLGNRVLPDSRPCWKVYAGCRVLGPFCRVHVRPIRCVDGVGAIVSGNLRLDWPGSDSRHCGRAVYCRVSRFAVGNR